MEKNLEEKLNGRRVLMQWHIIDECCACLVFENGDPAVVEDRVAFIEKTPRVLVNGEWIQGPKGEGGSFHEEGYSIYGFSKDSRKWCEDRIMENYVFIFDNELVLEFDRQKSFLSRNLSLLRNIKGIEEFLYTFYYNPSKLEETVKSKNTDTVISFPAIKASSKEEFLNMYDKLMINFRRNLEKELDNRLSQLDSFSQIVHSFGSGRIFVDGEIVSQRKINILYLFEAELKNPITIFYKGIWQNNVSNYNLVFFNYYKKQKLVTFEYRGITFSINLSNVKLTENFGHTLRKAMKSKNFIQLLRRLKQFNIEILEACSFFEFKI